MIQQQAASNAAKLKGREMPEGSVQQSINLYTNPEAAHLMKISLRTLQKLRDNGLIEFSQIGRIILYTEQQLLDFLSRHTKKAFGVQNHKEYGTAI